MARQLTPAERSALVARYQEVANACEVAREFGLSESGVRKILRNANSAKRSDLHARAVAQAVRKARRSLARKADLIDLYLLKHADKDDGVPGLEPKDIAALVNASANVLSKLLDADARIEQKQLARLTRKLRRAEIALLEAKARGDVQEIVVLTAEDAAAKARAVFGSRTALEAQVTDGSSDPGAAVVAGDAVPVSDPVDHRAE